MDQRIDHLLEAANGMIEGKFQVEIPVSGDDQVAQLGQTLEELGRLLEYRFKEIRILSRVTEKINAGLILDDVLNYAYESLHDIIPYQRIGFALLEDEGQVLRARWARTEAKEVKIYKGYSSSMKGSSLQEIIVSGQPRILNDLPAYLEQHPNSESTKLIVEEGFRSSLTCPLISAGKPIGFMFFSSMDKDSYRGAHVELFQQIAGQLAVIVEKGRLYQQLLEVSDLKNNFLGIVAHDLRNPLTVIKGNLDLLGDGLLGEMNDQQAKAVEHMRLYTKTMLLLVTDLLDVTSIESGKLTLRFRPVDFAVYLRGCVEFNGLLARAKSIDLRLEIVGVLPQVKIDPDRMNQVFNNLISNAVKFSPSGTVVTVRAVQAGGNIEIAVIDQGQGIPASELPKLFQFFGRTSITPTAGEHSTGLGLAIVRRIIDAHGGRIWVEPGVERGSVFKCTIPISPKASIGGS